MTFPTDWDIDQYRVEHECDEHWELRRCFLETHKDKFPEDRLVCLAQVFYNVEFMGCRYPEKTMQLVADLSNGVADAHREKMKTKLQRTFVQASDAASTKAKGLGRNQHTAHPKILPINFVKSQSEENDKGEGIENNSSDTNKEGILLNSQRDDDINIESVAEGQKTKKGINKKSIKNDTSANERESAVVEKQQDSNTEQLRPKRNIKKLEDCSKMKWIIEDTSMDVANHSSEGNSEGDTANLQEEKPQEQKSKKARKRKKKKKVKSAPGGLVTAGQSHLNVSEPLKRKEIDSVPEEPKRMKPSNDFNKIVLLEHHANQSRYEVIFNAASHAGRKFENQLTSTPTGERVSTLILDGVEIASATGATKREANEKSAVIAFQKLQECCYTIQIKDKFAGTVVGKQNSPSSAHQASTPAALPEHLAEDGKANRMMKLMGWGGGGLGKEQQGRQTPVQVEQRVGRIGLGANVNVNSPQFRNYILGILRKYHDSCDDHDLVFASDYSKEERAQIHVLARRFQRGLKTASHGAGDDRRLIVSKKVSHQQLLTNILKAGGSTDKYFVIPPRNS